MEIVRRCTRADIHSSVMLSPGTSRLSCWLEIEGNVDLEAELQRELSSAYWELTQMFEDLLSDDAAESVVGKSADLTLLQKSMTIAGMADRSE